MAQNMRIKTLTLALLLATSPSLLANDFVLGVTFSGHKVYPYAKIMINKSHPNNVNKFKWNSNHHLYWGSVVLASGYLLKSRPLKVAGGLIVFDDAVQHVFNVQSPFHLINDELGKWKLYRDFTNRFE